MWKTIISAIAHRRIIIQSAPPLLLFSSPHRRYYNRPHRHYYKERPTAVIITTCQLLLLLHSLNDHDRYYKQLLPHIIIQTTPGRLSEPRERLTFRRIRAIIKGQRKTKCNARAKQFSLTSAQTCVPSKTGESRREIYLKVSSTTCSNTHLPPSLLLPQGHSCGCLLTILFTLCYLLQSHFLPADVQFGNPNLSRVDGRPPGVL